MYPFLNWQIIIHWFTVLHLNINIQCMPYWSSEWPICYLNVYIGFQYGNVRSINGCLPAMHYSLWFECRHFFLMVKHWPLPIWLARSGQHYHGSNPIVTCIVLATPNIKDGCECVYVNIVLTIVLQQFTINTNTKDIIKCLCAELS